MTTRTPFDPVAAAIFSAGALEAIPAGHVAEVGNFAYRVARSAHDINVPVLPGWPEERREAPAKKPVPGRVYH